MKKLACFLLVLVTLFSGSLALAEWRGSLSDCIGIWNDDTLEYGFVVLVTTRGNARRSPIDGQVDEIVNIGSTYMVTSTYWPDGGGKCWYCIEYLPGYYCWISSGLTDGIRYIPRNGAAVGWAHIIYGDGTYIYR